MRGVCKKVDYYDPKYKSLRGGIYMHAIRVDSKPTLDDFLANHPIDFAFVCIDQLTDSESTRQDAVYSGLSEAGVPFIDSGVSITVENYSVTGSVTTSFLNQVLRNGRLSYRMEGLRAMSTAIATYSCQK